MNSHLYISVVKLNDIIFNDYDLNDFQVKDFEKVFWEESERSSMIFDRNKGITEIGYNHLNLPTRITWTNNKYITYQYNALGQKVKKQVEGGDSLKIVDYLDGFQTEARGSRTPKKRRSHRTNNSEQYAGNLLQFFPTSEGYVKATRLENSQTEFRFNYIYNYTDHLGNVRVSYTLDPQTGKLRIVDEHHYYPFGLRHEVHYPSGNRLDFHPSTTLNGGQVGDPVQLINVTKTEYMYKYNGKEWQDELGLNFYDYGARNYDAAIGRWSVHDPASEITLDPYGYVYNNPIQLVDENGEFPILSGIAGFFKGLFSSRSSFESGAKTRMGNALRTAGRYEKQAWQILGGLGTTDKNKSFGGQALQLLSRFTWELPNTVAGFVTAESTNVVANVNWVDYEAGATVLNTGYYFGAFTLGSFIVGDADIQADREDKIFKHEYGHYLQSQTFGPGYLLGFALPSVVRAGLLNIDVIGGEYDDFYTERNATKRGDNYFNKSKERQRNKTSFIHISETPCLGCYDNPPDWLKKNNAWSNE